MSRQNWKEARKRLAGGVSSPVRAFKAVGGTPFFSRQGFGPYLVNDEGKTFVDLCLSWGALILGHAEAGTVRAITEQAGRGTTFGTATELETRLAAEIQKAFPGMERIRFTSSGTEAAMSAIRLARGFTNRKQIVKFEGCYHGHSDGLLVKAGSGLATFGSPDSAGVPEEIAALTAVLPYNDTQAVRRYFAKRGRDTAAVIVEPVAANMGVVPAEPGFLETLRRETKKAGALLIFDEIISGFRVAYGGAETVYGIRPDITLLGKIIGGGLPVGAFGARAEIMSRLSPEGRVYQAGTLSGNPLSMAAGHAVLSRLSPALYKSLDARTGEWTKRLAAALGKKNGTFCIQRIGSMFTLFFGKTKVRHFRDAASQDTARFRRFFHKMLAGGVYVPPSAYEASFLSAAHGQTELELLLKAAR